MHMECPDGKAPAVAKVPHPYFDEVIERTRFGAVIVTTAHVL